MYDLEAIGAPSIFKLIRKSDYLDDNPMKKHFSGKEISFFFYSEMECKTLEGVDSLVHISRGVLIELSFR